MSQSYVFGIHAVQSLLDRNPGRIKELFILEERSDQKIQHLVESAKQKHIKVRVASRHQLDHMTHNEVHQGVVADCDALKAQNENDLFEMLEAIEGNPLLLILDGVQDPHNLGACLRSADAAGVHAVIVPKDKSVGMTPTVSKVACGAAEVVPFIQVTNLARTMRELKECGIWLYGAAGEATASLYQTNLNLPLGLVLGAEGEGLRRLTKEHCDGLLKIPMQGTVSSLNVSVATGIVLFEAVRQRS